MKRRKRRAEAEALRAEIADITLWFERQAKDFAAANARLINEIDSLRAELKKWEEHYCG